MYRTRWSLFIIQENNRTEGFRSWRSDVRWKSTILCWIRPSTSESGCHITRPRCPWLPATRTPCDWEDPYWVFQPLWIVPFDVYLWTLSNCGKIMRYKNAKLVWKYSNVQRAWSRDQEIPWWAVEGGRWVTLAQLLFTVPSRAAWYRKRLCKHRIWCLFQSRFCDIYESAWIHVGQRARNRNERTVDGVRQK